MRKKNKNKLYDPKTAIIAADAFRNHARKFIGKLPKGSLDEAAQFSIHNLGECIASATNLALAVELYLKALRIVVGSPASEDHNLWSLFKHLPVKLKEEIETHYNQLNTKQIGKLASLELEISTEPFKDNNEEDNNEEKLDNLNNGLKQVLNKSKDAFITWRYIHEGAKEGEYIRYNYEFSRLELICDIIRAQLVTRL